MEFTWPIVLLGGGAAKAAPETNATAATLNIVDFFAFIILLLYIRINSQRIGSI
jgi:hypothetical protein